MVNESKFGLFPMSQGGPGLYSLKLVAVICSWVTSRPPDEDVVGTTRPLGEVNLQTLKCFASGEECCGKLSLCPGTATQPEHMVSVLEVTSVQLPQSPSVVNGSQVQLAVGQVNAKGHRAIHAIEHSSSDGPGEVCHDF